jgi:hypothetical protein
MTGISRMAFLKGFFQTEGFRKDFFAPLSRGGALGSAVAGVCSPPCNSAKLDIEDTPLHPSQEGNRTLPALLFCFAYSGFETEGFRENFFAPLSRGGALGSAVAGVCSPPCNSAKLDAEYTPLHPSQEGNRTLPRFLQITPHPSLLTTLHK